MTGAAWHTGWSEGGIAACLGVIDLVAGGLLLYVAAPAQRLLSRAPSSRRCVIAGCVLVAGGLLLLPCWFGAGTGVFVAATLLMTLWSFLPVGLALLHRAPRP